MAEEEHRVEKLGNPFVFDFHKLACLEPQLRPYVFVLNHRTVCNFKDQKSLVAVTKAILKHYFHIQWDCPSLNLCPRVPSRLNYLLWIYLQLSHITISTVLDVGTGATLIYPLLGHALFKWHFIATELSRQSFDHSLKLVGQNNLQQEVDLRMARQNSSKEGQDGIWQDDRILEGTVRQDEEVDVVICNPPFFEEETGTLTQMQGNQHHTQGGQYTFFFNLYRQSYQYPSIKYFSCLIGLHSNFIDIKRFLIKEDQTKLLQFLRFGQIHQGNSSRYIVLWRPYLIR